MDELITIDNLSFGYGSSSLHKNIDMKFSRGKVSAIMGGSGCGKTTILKLIAGQLSPKSGKVIVDGQIVHEQDREAASNLGHQDAQHLAHLLPPRRPLCLHPDPDDNRVQH